MDIQNIILGVKMNFIAKKAIILLLILFASYSEIVYAKEKSMFIEDRRDLALDQCLLTNYRKLGWIDSSKKIEDYSFWTYKISKNESEYYSIDAAIHQHDFVEKMTGNFYKQNYYGAYAVEGGPKWITHIFADCMKFYKSRALRKYLMEHPPY